MMEETLRLNKSIKLGGSDLVRLFVLVNSIGEFGYEGSKVAEALPVAHVANVVLRKMIHNCEELKGEQSILSGQFEIELDSVMAYTLYEVVGLFKKFCEEEKQPASVSNLGERLYNALVN